METLAQAQLPGPVHMIADVACLTHMLERSLWQPSEAETIRRNIQVLSEAAQAGVSRVPDGIQQSLKLIDPLLRARWDFVVDMWAIERWCEERDFCRWEIIAHRYHLGAKLFADLRAGDTWTDGKSPEQRLRERREEAERIRASNERASDDKVAAAIDKLTPKRMQEFIAVEEAIATGDSINCRGQMADTMNKLEQASRTAPDIPRGQSINRKLGKPRIKRISRISTFNKGRK